MLIAECLTTLRKEKERYEKNEMVEFRPITLRLYFLLCQAWRLVLKRMLTRSKKSKRLLSTLDVDSWVAIHLMPPLWRPLKLRYHISDLLDCCGETIPNKPLANIPELWGIKWNLKELLSLYRFHMLLGPLWHQGLCWNILFRSITYFKENAIRFLTYSSYSSFNMYPVFEPDNVAMPPIWVENATPSRKPIVNFVGVAGLKNLFDLLLNTFLKFKIRKFCCIYRKMVTKCSSLNVNLHYRCEKCDASARVIFNCICAKPLRFVRFFLSRVIAIAALPTIN